MAWNLKGLAGGLSQVGQSGPVQDWKREIMRIINTAGGSPIRYIYIIYRTSSAQAGGDEGEALFV